MWRRPRKRLQSGGVDRGRWSGRPAKRPLLSAPFANGAAHCNFVSWLGNKTPAKINRPHPLRSIKGHVCLSLLSNDRGISPPFWGVFSLLVDTGNGHKHQSTRVSASPQGGDACMRLRVGLLSHCRLLIQRGVVWAEGSWGCYPRRWSQRGICVERSTLFEVINSCKAQFFTWFGSMTLKYK